MKKNISLLIFTLLMNFTYVNHAFAKYEIIEGLDFMTNEQDHTASIVNFNENLKSDVVIPETIMVDGTEYTVTAIGDNAFHTCERMKSITLPNTLKTIGSGAFIQCFNLSSIVIPNSVSYIGETAFMNCTSLSSVILPDSLEEFNSSTFYNCI